LSIIALVVGQWYFYHWLASTYSIIVEPSRPLVSTLFSLFAFSFILIAHERKLMKQNEKKRILDELKSAHDMQMGLMPTEDPKIDGFDISGICLPANEVGGDYFDYVWLDETKNKLGIAVADVSGKAMKAAITAVMTSGMVYREVGTNETPKSILTKINRPMYLKTDKNVFTALSFAIIDLTKKELTLSNAGQMPPLLRRGDMLQSIKVDGPRLPLGVKEAVEYNEVSRQLQSGDVLILYTDGIIEAKNVKEELWGFERMEEAVKNLTPALTAKEMCEALVNQATQFAGSATQHDDMTVVVVKVL
jgi:serine phosphatase RsbU (regulator of sigma subunit)